MSLTLSPISRGLEKCFVILEKLRVIIPRTSRLKNIEIGTIQNTLDKIKMTATKLALEYVLNYVGEKVPTKWNNIGTCLQSVPVVGPHKLPDCIERRPKSAENRKKLNQPKTKKKKE